MPLSSHPSFHLGQPIRPFRLPEPLTGRLVGPEDYPEKPALLVAFICNLCPDVQHVAGALAALTRDFEPHGLQALAVNATSGDLSAEAPAEVAGEALRRGYVFPYLIDQTQGTAQSFGAVCTPDFYLFDRERRLAYHGRFDETRFGGGRPAHGRDLARAIIKVLRGEAAPEHQVAASGCAIRPRGRGRPLGASVRPENRSAAAAPHDLQS